MLKRQLYRRNQPNPWYKDKLGLPKRYTAVVVVYKQWPDKADLISSHYYFRKALPLCILFDHSYLAELPEIASRTDAWYYSLI